MMVFPRSIENSIGALSRRETASRRFSMGEASAFDRNNSNNASRRMIRIIMNMIRNSCSVYMRKN